MTPGFPCCLGCRAEPCTIDSIRCPERFLVTLAGYSDSGDCAAADCARLNDSFVLTRVQVDNSCAWRYIDPTGWCGLANEIFLGMGPSGADTLVRVGLGTNSTNARGSWTKLFTTIGFDCTALNVEDLPRAAPNFIGCDDGFGESTPTCKITSL